MKKYLAPELITEETVKTSIMLGSDVEIDMGMEAEEE